MPVQLDKRLGIIKGGVCEQGFRRRVDRERGAKCAAQYLIDSGILRWRQGWLRFTKEPKRLSLQKLHQRIRQYTRLDSTEVEIGWRRIMQELLPAIKRYRKGFRKPALLSWAHDLAGLSFEDVGPTRLGPWWFSLGPPVQPALFEKWRRLRGK